ncbi:hypothetical protein BG004_002353 [Podila humilis]|nr:hypothetical protein BG004_002353 [Podila humilis]
MPDPDSPLFKNTGNLDLGRRSSSTAMDEAPSEPSSGYSLEKESDLENQGNSEKDQTSFDDPPPHNLTRTKLALLLLGLALCVFLASMDISIIATALPRIASDFNAQTQMSWVATAYLLAYNSFNPLYGRLSDIFGRKYILLTACTVFLVGSIGCAAASSIVMLILFRAVQGFGACGLSSIAMITVGDLFTDVVVRAKVQSVFWASFAISSIVGPVVGGIFVEHSTWRWCFWINLPLCVLAISAIVLFHRLPFQQTAFKEKLMRVDYLGVFFILAAITCFLLPLSLGGTTYSWKSTEIIVMFCVFVFLLGILILVESRATEAIIPPAMFKNRDVVVIYFVNAIAGLIFMGCTFYIPLYFQVVQGKSATTSGLLLMPNVVGFSAMTVASSFLLKWFRDFRHHIWIGMSIVTISVGLMILFDVQTGIGAQIAIILLMGCGMGLIFQNCIIAVQQVSRKEDMAVATVLCQFSNSLGNSIGVAVCGTTLNNALAKNLAALPEAIQSIVAELDVVNNVSAMGRLEDDMRVLVIRAYADSFQILFKVLTPIAAAGLLAALLLRKLAK